MKTIVLLAAIFSSMLHSQVMNDAQILLNGKTGINLSVIRSGGKSYPSLGIGVGFFRGMDVEIGARTTSTTTFINMNTEIALKYKPNLSLSVGGHIDGKTTGADITVNSSSPLGRYMTMYTGVDVDVNFAGGTQTVPAWYFMGLNAFLSKHIESFIEADVAVSSAAVTQFAGGVRIYF